MSRPLFSVITIGLNDLEGLKETTASVLSQTESDFDWILIDGGSTDGSLEFLQGLNEPRADISSGKDGGIYPAMNRGLERATGQYVIFMNSGDAFADESVLRKAREAIEREKEPDFLYGHMFKQDQSGVRTLHPAYSHTRRAYGMFAGHASMFYRRDWIGAQRYDTSYRIAGDYEFTCRLLTQPTTIVALDFPVCVFVAGGVSQNQEKKGRAENWRVQTNILKVPFPQRATIRLGHLSTSFLRKVAPNLYKNLRKRTGKKVST
ncbi:MAG: glycosyltransferase [Fimbriimonadaceae bacterium]|jgi:putative colanic acid biosynthesis glycosyltransferase|nr:glycosyltransferase [Fimbriimonadaceae bacterium]